MTCKLNLLLFCCLTLGALSEDPTVVTPLGNIVGKNTNIFGKSVDEYLGIPFAKPPIGDLRFKKTVPIDKYEKPIEATKMPVSCPQISNPIEEAITKVKPVISEDCLYLNIWNPNPDSEKSLKPVMFWIYGGAFEAGSINAPFYNGGILSSYGDVMVVTANYRVGLFGFFTSGNKNEPGNLGLHDQVTALRWVHENIRHFGGDPSRVTIFGESAGSISVALHIISPMSEGLFSRAILESGTHLTPLLRRNNKKIIEVGNIIAMKAGCATEKENLYSETEKVMSCLREKDVVDLVKYEESVKRRQFSPLIDDEFLSLEALLNFKAGKGRDVEVIIGVNKDEGDVMLSLFFPETNFNEPEKMMTKSQAMKLMSVFLLDFFKENANLIKPYFEGIEEDDVAGSRKAISEILTDMLFVCPSLMFADQHAQNTKNIYFYYFTHRSYTPWPLPEWLGVGHFFEVPYVFGMPMNPAYNYPILDIEMSKDIMSMWTNFTKGSYPSADWPTYETQSNSAYEIKPQGRSLKQIMRSSLCNNLWNTADDEFLYSTSD